MTPPKVIVDSDLFVEYLLAGRNDEPVLRTLMQTSFCYTTVITAADLFAMASTAKQKSAVKDALSAVKILGINARSALLFGQLLRSYPRLSAGDCYVAGICLESRLPICTFAPQRFSAVRKLAVLPADSLR